MGIATIAVGFRFLFTVIMLDANHEIETQTAVILSIVSIGIISVGVFETLKPLYHSVRENE